MQQTPHLSAPTWGFTEPGEWGAKQLGSREQDGTKSREQGAQEVIQGAGNREKSQRSREQRKLSREQHKNSWGSREMAKNNLGSIEINLGSIEKIIQGAGRSGLNYEGSREPRPPACRSSKIFYIPSLTPQTPDSPVATILSFPSACNQFSDPEMQNLSVKKITDQNRIICDSCCNYCEQIIGYNRART